MCYYIFNKVGVLMKNNEKKFILLIFLFVSVCFLSFDINKSINISVDSKKYATPANLSFVDDDFYKCVVASYNMEKGTDLGFDVNLTDEQLSAIEYVDCVFNPNLEEEIDIADLTGIEKLVNLKTFWVQSVSISSVDLSKNVNLEQLYFSSSQLMAIDLSKNINLKQLFLEHTPLSTIDLSKNVNLEGLFFNRMDLTTINLDNNINLKSLSIDYTPLTEIKLDDNVNLEVLELNFNDLTLLDLSNNIKLKELKFFSNNISSVDLSNNVNLEKLELFLDEPSTIDLSNNVALINLDLKNNGLETIDLSYNKALQELDLSDNSLSTLDLSNNVNLKSLNLGSNNLEEIELSKNTALTELDLSFNKLVALDLDKNVELVNLSLSHNNLTILNLTTNEKLKNVYLDNNSIKDVFCNNVSCPIDLVRDVQYKNIYIYNNDFSNVQDSVLLNLVDYLGSDKDSYNVDYSYNDVNDEEQFYNFEYKINRVTLDSDFYSIKDDYIYTGMPKDDDTILNEVKIVGFSWDLMLDGMIYDVIEDGKYIIKRNNEIIKEFEIAYCNSDRYNMDGNYVNIYNDDISIFLSSVECHNCVAKVKANGTYLESGSFADDYQIIIMIGDEIIKTYHAISFSSDKYNLDQDFIHVLDNDISSFINNFNCSNCSVKVFDGTNYLENGEFGDNYKLVFMHNNEVLKEYELRHPISGIDINTSELKLDLSSNNSFKLSVNIYPSYAYDMSISWTSSDINVATVDSDGVVTAKGVGNAVITATSIDGSTDICTVEVSGKSYTITYKDGDIIKTESYVEGEKVNFKTDFTRPGFNLTGWIYNDVKYSLTDNFIMPSSDIELIATWDKVDIGIKNYEVDGKYIFGISFNTNISDLDLGIDAMYNVVIYNHNNEIKTSGRIGTGDIIRVFLNSDLYDEYVVIIKGDVNGDGGLSVSDIIRICKYIRAKNPDFFDECYVKAADTNGDGSISVSDIIKINNVIRGKQSF